MTVSSRGNWLALGVGLVYGPVPSTAPGGAPNNKGEAWEDCVAAGLRMGVPAHAWVKCHTRYGWGWRTVSYAKLQQRFRAMTHRRKQQ